MKIAIVIIRTLMGILLVMTSVMFLFNLVPAPDPKEIPAGMKIFNDGLTASIYLVPLVKVIELICGLALISGRFVPLAAIVLFPISVNIVLVHAFLAPASIVAALFIFLGNIFLIFNYRKNYEPILAVK
jgi:uncharacterized membrane protein YphA (DoxX/SURF4 family)